MSKGQVALEYLVIAAFVLLAAGLIFIYSTITLDQNLKLVKADKALIKLAEAADTVSIRGPNNQIFVDVVLPLEIESGQITIANRTIMVKIPSATGLNERYAATNAVLTPTVLSPGGGFATIKVEMVDENVVFTET